MCEGMKTCKTCRHCLFVRHAITGRRLHKCEIRRGYNGDLMTVRPLMDSCESHERKEAAK